MGDLHWIPWVFRFLKRNWLSQSEFVVCAPMDCSDALKSMQDILGGPILIVEMEQWTDSLSHRIGWMHQQYVKHHADLYCQGDYITFIDSDCILLRPTDFEKHLMVGDKPVMWYAEFSKIHAPWITLMGQVLAMESPYEFMRSFPLTYHKSTIANSRKHIEQMHGMPLHDFIRHKARTWSEFNCIGFYAYVFQNNLYEWMDTYAHTMHEEEIYRHDRVRQFHNVYDWNDGTIPYLKDLYGESIEDSCLDDFTNRVIKTPVHGQIALIDSLIQYIVKGEIAIDVGAHQGLHAVAYAKAGALVYAFEPVASSFTTLWRALYPFGGTAMPLAISDSSGTVGLVEDTDCTEASYVTKGEEIPCVSLDELFSQMFPKHKKRPKICLIKIDTEGFEPQVLKGALNLIKTDRPAVVVECQKATLKRNGFSRDDLRNFFQELNYDVSNSLTDPRSSTKEEDYFYDMIATPMDKIGVSMI